MTTTQALPWLQGLRAGTLDISDLRNVEEARLEVVLREVTALFPVQFLDRRQRNKREVGLAQSKRRRPGRVGAAHSKKPLRKRIATTDTFQRCLLLTGEAGQLTTLAFMTQLVVRTPQGVDEAIELECGAGYSVYRDPDGWKSKLLEQRTISLTPPALRERGWQLDPAALPAVEQPDPGSNP
jgi:hypothetical protein